MSFEKRLVVLYGSQTFTAQEVAERAWRRSKALGFTGPVQALDEYTIQHLIRERFVLFVCATTGQGDEPDNMKNFWRFLLRRNLPSHSLQKLRFGVLALGDSSYAKYNFVGKKLHKRLLQLGATPLLEIGLCDYQHDLGHDATLGPWLDNLWIRLKDFYSDINLDKSTQHVFVPRWKVSLLKSTEENLIKGIAEQNGFANRLSRDIYFRNGQTSQFVETKELDLIDNKRTTSEDHFQDVRLMRFKMADDSLLNYKPGDIFNLRPRNSKEDIEELFNIFQSHNIDIEPEYRLLVEQCHEDMPVPKFLQEPLSLYEIAEQYWDLNYIPTKYVFSLLSTVSEHKLEREKCLELCSAEGQEDLLNYCRRPRRTILEVLQDFHRSASKLTIEVIFELFSPIKPRSFSIASSAISNGSTMELLVAIVKYYSKLKKPRLGLCSNWMKSLRCGDRVFGWLKSGSMIFPDDQNTPCILIGPGTGLAPFRSFLLEREATGTARADTLVLFFGCRYAARDYHCREDLERFEKEGKATLVCAFSRDQERKIYVQHRIKEHPELMWKLINGRQAMIFIAGSSKNMPDNVKDALREISQESSGMDKEEVEAFVREMESSGRLQVETW